MKFHNYIPVLISICFPVDARSAIISLDEFSLGDIILGSDFRTSHESSFETPITQERSVSGVGFGSWTVVQTPGSGNVTYNLTGGASGRTSLSLKYWDAQGSSILGYDAFAIDIINVQGIGELVVEMDGFRFRSPRISFSSAQTIIYPFSFLDSRVSLDDFSKIEYTIYAGSSDFSVTFDNLRIIPEPSSMLLVALSIAIPLFRRQRAKLS